jgi:hypothetical protein
MVEVALFMVTAYLVASGHAYPFKEGVASKTAIIEMIGDMAHNKVSHYKQQSDYAKLKRDIDYKYKLQHLKMVEANLSALQITSDPESLNVEIPYKDLMPDTSSDRIKHDVIGSLFDDEPGKVDDKSKPPTQTRFGELMKKS